MPASPCAKDRKDRLCMGRERGESGAVAAPPPDVFRSSAWLHPCSASPACSWCSTACCCACRACSAVGGAQSAPAALCPSPGGCGTCRGWALSASPRSKCDSPSIPWLLLCPSAPLPKLSPGEHSLTRGDEGMEEWACSKGWCWLPWIAACTALRWLPRPLTCFLRGLALALALPRRWHDPGGVGPFGAAGGSPAPRAPPPG